MKAVWSFWSKPFNENKTQWPNEKYHLMSWVVSFATTRKHYPDTLLVTDDYGARVLVDSLGLGFRNVSTRLNCLSHINSDWWALAKIYTYGMQTEPFLHLDYDVFLWERLPIYIEEAAVFSQNPEPYEWIKKTYKPEWLEKVIGEKGWLPEEWKWFREQSNNQLAACCGIFGGKKVDFIKYYSIQAIKLVESNYTLFQKNNYSSNILVEQYLLSAILSFHNKRIKSPFHGVKMKYLFMDVEEAFYTAENIGFTHLITNSKKNENVCKGLEKRVKNDLPHYYHKILQLTAESRSPCHKAISW